MKNLRGLLFEKLMELPDADVSSGAGGSLRGRLLAIGGASTRTRSGINLTRAAEVLQVSRRTVERWVRAAEEGTGQRPSAEHAKALATKARQMATTQAGRKAALARSPLVEKIRQKGRLAVLVKGYQGPAPTPFPGDPLDTSYMRARETLMKITGADVQQMLDAYERGGDRGFHDWMLTKWGGPNDDPTQIYLSTWKFAEIDRIRFDPDFKFLDEG